MSYLADRWHICFQRIGLANLQRHVVWRQFPVVQICQLGGPRIYPPTICLGRHAPCRGQPGSYTHPTLHGKRKLHWKSGGFVCGSSKLLSRVWKVTDFYLAQPFNFEPSYCSGVTFQNYLEAIKKILSVTIIPTFETKKLIFTDNFQNKHTLN